MTSENEIVSKIYGGKVEIKFFGPTEDKPNRHIYTMNGERKRSTTGIIGLKDKSGALVPWSQEQTAKHLLELLETGTALNEENLVRAVFASDKEKESAANLGTEIHNWCELFIQSQLKKGKTPPMPQDKNVIKGTTSFLEWVDSHKVKFLWSEKVLYSKKYDYMGKADFAAIVDGERCICDIKTGNGMYKEVRLQLAAYRQADEEETKQKYAGRWAIQIAKESEEAYQARMMLKNKIKKFLGKKESEVYPYKVFNDKFLDLNKGDYKKDLKGFLNLAGIQEWDSASSL